MNSHTRLPQLCLSLWWYTCIYDDTGITGIEYSTGTCVQKSTGNRHI
jgi:hypothetical protein